MAYGDPLAQVVAMRMGFSWRSGTKALSSRQTVSKVESTTRAISLSVGNCLRCNSITRPSACLPNTVSKNANRRDMGPVRNRCMSQVCRCCCKKPCAMVVWRAASWPICCGCALPLTKAVTENAYGAEHKASTPIKSPGSRPPTPPNAAILLPKGCSGSKRLCVCATLCASSLPMPQRSA